MTSTAVPSTPIPRVLSPIDAAKQLEALSPMQPPTQKAKDPKGEEEYTFSISYTDGAGNVHAGTFRNRILSLEERIEIGAKAHLMLRGLPWDNIDPDTRWLCMTLSHLSISLIEKPEWFDKTVMSMKGRHQRAVEVVFREVAAHEAFFRGP